MKNKDVAIHFTKIARDKFQIYNFQTKDNQIANTRDLAAYLTNLRGGMALDNSFYSKLISMPNFSTIAISQDALTIKKAAANGKIEPWKLEKTADGEVFVSAIDEEEDDTILKKSASCHLKHHYVISIKAKNENQKITTYASLKKSACIPETEIELSPINDYVNFDYYSEKNPYDVIQAIVDLLVATGVAIEPSQVECCHDFCDCGMTQVGPVVPCEEDEYILDCYGEKPTIGNSVDSLRSYAEAHNHKHFKIYAFDKVVFDSDAIKRTAADETTQKTKYTLAGYTDGKVDFIKDETFDTIDGAKKAFNSFKEKAHKKDDFGNELYATEFYIYETKDNSTTHDKTWRITSPVDLLPMQKETPVEEKTEVEVKEPTLPEEPKKEETAEPQPLPTGEKKDEIEEKVETPEGQKLEEKVEETVEPKASVKENIKKEATTREEVINWLKEEIPFSNKVTGEEMTLNENFANKIVIGGPTERVLKFEQYVNEKFNTPDKQFMVTTEPVEGIEGYTELTIYKSEDGDIDKKSSVNKEAEINADPKVVLDKLRTGDLLKGTEERKEGLKKVVNDETYKEEVEKLKNDGAITEEEIKEVKDSIDKESKVVKKDDKYQVQSEKGKNLGTYDTKEEAEERLKEVEMFKHMDKKADTSSDNSEVQEAINNKDSEKVLHLLEDNSISPADSLYQQAIDVLVQDTACAYDAINSGVISYSRNSEDYEKVVDSIINNNDIKSAIWLIARNNYTGKSFDKLLSLALQDKSLLESELKTYSSEKFDEFVKSHIKGASEKDNITKEADKVLVDKNTNQPLKPGEDPTNKELVEVEVDKSQTNTTTASNAVYNLFMKSASIEVNKEELSLLTAAYHSPIFKKVAYLGPTAFAFRDQHAIFTVDGNRAICHKEADLTTVEIKKQEQVNPGSLDSLSDSQLRDYIASLNKKLEVK